MSVTQVAEVEVGLEAASRPVSIGGTEKRVDFRSLHEQKSRMPQALSQIHSAPFDNTCLRRDVSRWVVNCKEQQLRIIETKTPRGGNVLLKLVRSCDGLYFIFNQETPIVFCCYPGIGDASLFVFSPLLFRDFRDMSARVSRCGGLTRVMLLSRYIAGTCATAFGLRLWHTSMHGSHGFPLESTGRRRFAFEIQTNRKRGGSLRVGLVLKLAKPISKRSRSSR